MSDQRPWTEEESKLLAALRRSIEWVGPERFSRAALVTPTEEFFAEPWSADVSGVERALRTLLDRAGLEDVQCLVTADPVELAESDSEPAVSPHAGAGLWLSTLADPLAVFGASFDRIDDVLGAASHEVAHLYLARRAAERAGADGYRSGPDHASRASDVEALAKAVEVSLGFGLLAANHALRRRTLPGIKYSTVVTEPRPGHLAPEATCFLFAAQVVSRGVGRLAQASLFSDLGDDARVLVRAQIKRFAGVRPALLEALGRRIAS